MSEQWAIAIAGIISTLALALIGWGASSLAGLRKDIQAFVRREDCAADMGEHCDKIGGLEKRLGKLENRVTAVEVSVDLYHPNNKLGEQR